MRAPMATPAQDAVFYARKAEGARVVFRWGDVPPGARQVIVDLTLGRSSSRPAPESGEFETRLAAGHEYRWRIDDAAGKPVVGPFRFTVRHDYEAEFPPGGRELWDLFLAQLPLTFLDEDFTRSEWVTTLHDDKTLGVSHVLGEDEDLLDDRLGRVSVTGEWWVEGGLLRITKLRTALDVEDDPADDRDIDRSVTRGYPIAVADGALWIAGRRVEGNRWG